MLAAVPHRFVRTTLGNPVNNRLQPSWLLTVGRWSPLFQTAILLVAFALVFACCGPIGWMVAGSQGVVAAAWAVAICCFAGVLSLLLGEIIAAFTSSAIEGSDGNAAATAVFAPMAISSMVRLGLPLLACLFVQQRIPSLVEAGFAWYLLAAFGTGLVVETLFVSAKAQVNLRTNSPHDDSPIDRDADGSKDPVAT